MSKTYILEADPTRCGGIQQFVRDVSTYLPANEAVLLAYYGDLANEKSTDVPVVMLNDHEKCSWWGKIFGRFRFSYLSFSALKRNIALLLDIPRIRRNLAAALPGGDVLILNSASAMLMFCPEKVLKNNKIILVQHTAPQQMYSLSYYFGGIFRSKKISLFKKYVDAFVMLSPFEEKELAPWLPLDGKHTVVIRHKTEIPPVKLTEDPPPKTVSFLGRLADVKRVDRVIETAGYVPDFHFNIYGNGPLEIHLKKMAEGMKNITFHGYVSEPSTALCCNAISIFTSEYEGYPISGIESVAWGRPLLVLNTFPAAADLVVNGRNGILMQEFSPEAFAAALRKISDDYDQYYQESLKLREKFSADVIRDQWIKLISDIKR